MVERTLNGQADLYVADRKTGAPVEKADVALWADGQHAVVGRDGRRRHGSADDEQCAEAAQRGGTPENVWILARHGADAALVTPWSYGFGQQNQREGRPISTRTGPCTGRDTRCTSRRSCGRRRTTRCSCRRADADARGDRQQRQDGFHEGHCALGARNAGGGSRPAERCGARLLQHQSAVNRQLRATAASTWRSTRSRSTR